MNKKLGKLVYALSSNARLTTKKLGQLLSVSQQNASYMVKSLLKKDILQKYLTVIDPARFGLTNVIVLYNYKSFDKRSITNLKYYLLEHPYIVTAEEVSQGADLLLEYSVPNLSFFNKKHTEFLYKYQSLLQVADIYIVVVKHLYEKKYLVNTHDYNETIVCGDRNRFMFNTNQKKVLLELNKNAKEPVINIAHKLKIDSKTVVRIKKQLEKQKIILKYSMLFNYNKLDIVKKYLFIHLVHKDPNEIKKLLEFTKQNENIVEAVKIIGDYELMLVIEKHKQSNQVVTDLRKNFQITKYKIIESDNLFKQNYIPDESG